MDQIISTWMAQINHFNKCCENATNLKTELKPISRTDISKTNRITRQRIDCSLVHLRNSFSWLMMTREFRPLQRLSKRGNRCGPPAVKRIDPQTGQPHLDSSVCIAAEEGAAGLLDQSWTRAGLSWTKLNTSLLSRKMNPSPKMKTMRFKKIKKRENPKRLLRRREKNICNEKTVQCFDRSSWASSWASPAAGLHAELDWSWTGAGLELD